MFTKLHFLHSSIRTFLCQCSQSYIFFTLILEHFCVYVHKATFSSLSYLNIFVSMFTKLHFLHSPTVLEHFCVNVHQATFSWLSFTRTAPIRIWSEKAEKGNNCLDWSWIKLNERKTYLVLRNCPPDCHHKKFEWKG